MLIRDFDAVVALVEYFHDSFRFERSLPVFLRPVSGRDEIVVEDRRGRLMGWIHEDHYLTLEEVMGRFTWGNLSLSGWMKCEIGTQALVITVRIRVVCVTAEEEEWFREIFDYWWGLEGEAHNVSA